MKQYKLKITPDVFEEIQEAVDSIQVHEQT
jgi:hypothetical protein